MGRTDQAVASIRPNGPESRCAEHPHIGQGATRAGRDGHLTVGTPTAVSCGDVSVLQKAPDRRPRRSGPWPSDDNREQDQLQSALSLAVTAGKPLRCHLLRLLGRLEKSALLGCVVSLHCIHHVLNALRLGLFLSVARIAATHMRDAATCRDRPEGAVHRTLRTQHGALQGNQRKRHHVSTQ